METGIISLHEFYGYISKNKDIPHRLKDRNIYKPFKVLIDKSIRNVPEKTGWYFWLNMQNNTIPIYIGKSDRVIHLTIYIKELKKSCQKNM